MTGRPPRSSVAWRGMRLLAGLAVLLAALVGATGARTPPRTHTEADDAFGLNVPFEVWTVASARAQEVCGSVQRGAEMWLGRASVVNAFEYPRSLPRELVLVALIKQLAERGYTRVDAVADPFFDPDHDVFLWSPKGRRLGHTYTLVPTRALVKLTLADRSPVACLLRVSASVALARP